MNAWICHHSSNSTLEICAGVKILHRKKKYHSRYLILVNDMYVEAFKDEVYWYLQLIDGWRGGYICDKVNITKRLTTVESRWWVFCVCPTLFQFVCMFESFHNKMLEKKQTLLTVCKHFQNQFLRLPHLCSFQLDLKFRSCHSLKTFYNPQN